MGAVGAAARRRDLGESLQRVRPGLRAPLLVRSGGREVPAWLHDQEQGEHPRTTSGQLRPAVVWVHGGGYVGGDPAQEHGLCTLIARRTGGLALSVEYRLRAAAPPSGGAGRLPHRPHLAARARRRARSRPRPRRGRGARPARRTSRVSRTRGSGAATSTSSSTRTWPTRTACARRGARVDVRIEPGMYHGAAYCTWSARMRAFRECGVDALALALRAGGSGPHSSS